MKYFVSLLFIITFGLFYNDQNIITYDNGVLINEIPVQERISHKTPLKSNGYKVMPLATFDIKARVLSKANYYMGRETDLSPVDLALGWKRMSDQQVLDKIDIVQSKRWYRWTVTNYPIPKKEIEENSANMHIIPGNDSVKDALGDIKKEALYIWRVFLFLSEQVMAGNGIVL